jgi:D-sedoheptulose 7-phosphate isomerase
MAAGSIEVEVGEAIARRRAAGLALVDLSGDLTRAAHAMATRFRRGGALIAFGVGTSSADAQHVAVEFAHPVVVGKRAVPALALTGDVATLSGLAEHGEAGSLFAYPVEHLARPGDVVIALIGAEPSRSASSALAAARALGALTVALAGEPAAGAADLRADHLLPIRSRDALIVREMQVTAYHVLWELVQVFLERAGATGPGPPR